MVYVPHQMNKTLLLLAWQRVVHRVEVADNHSAEPAEHFVQEFTFSRWAIYLQDIEQAGEYPNVACFASEPHPGLVGVYELSRHQLLLDQVVRLSVVARREMFQAVNVRITDRALAGGAWRAGWLPIGWPAFF
jgi:hypothetical protein